MTRNCGKLAATTNYTQQTYIVQCRKYKRYEPKEHEREPKRREATTTKSTKHKMLYGQAEISQGENEHFSSNFFSRSSKSIAQNVESFVE